MIKALLRPGSGSAAINASTLILRLSLGLLMANHGFRKLTGYAEMAPDFLDFMGLGGEVSLALAVFAEFFCSMLLVLGMFTRFALIPLIATMLVAVFIAHAGQDFGEKEHALLFLFPYLSLLILGPGKYSVDYLMFR